MNTLHSNICSQKNLVSAMRGSLRAKMLRLLNNPVVGAIDLGADKNVPDDSSKEPSSRPVFAQLAAAADKHRPRTDTSKNRRSFVVDPVDHTCQVTVVFDYESKWKGRAKEVREEVESAIEGEVSLLTEQEFALLKRSPMEFLEILPRPVAAELVRYETEWVGASERITKVFLATQPEHTSHLRYVAIIPNLVPLQRQLHALAVIESGAANRALAPLRCLVGLEGAEDLEQQTSENGSVEPLSVAEGELLDEHQMSCVQKAITTPHFCVIEGPPGSGKTTVISAITRRLLDAGQRVLVVSPTHVAVDNVVEKLVGSSDSGGRDRLEARSLPVRFASRNNKLSVKANEYWVGPHKQRRAATITRRLANCLINAEALPQAESLFARLDVEKTAGSPPLTSAIVAVEPIICGTPLGIQSHPALKNCSPCAFDVLIVDEVSKMTLPEFLAVAVYAKRWVLVGDPAQLPPYCDAVENADTLTDVLSHELELVCSVGAVIERTRLHDRSSMRLVVVANRAEPVRNAIRAHLESKAIKQCPTVSPGLVPERSGIVVCEPKELPKVLLTYHKSRRSNNELAPWLLCEKPRTIPDDPSRQLYRRVDERHRAAASIFDNAFNVYHSRPWGSRAKQKLRTDQFRNGIRNYLPSRQALAILGTHNAESSSEPAMNVAPDCRELLRSLNRSIAERYAVNTVSVYDWLTGIPTDDFDIEPLSRLSELENHELIGAVAPHVGSLKKQYRMHASVSAVPRELFYFGEALQDGVPPEDNESRVKLMQVEATGPGGESNQNEIDVIVSVIRGLATQGTSTLGARPTSIMVITPYSEQERQLRRCLEPLAPRLREAGVEYEISTLDRCQGREADYVFISLVRSRASIFMDMPKRWNVALTRAKEGLFIVGNIEAFLEEARRQQPGAPGRRGRNPGVRSMTVLARILEEFSRLG